MIDQENNLNTYFDIKKINSIKIENHGKQDH